MVYRVFVEKRKGLDNEAMDLRYDIRHNLLIKNLTTIRVFNRYDVENIESKLFEYAKKTVFSEPQLDITYSELPVDEGFAFATEYLPGQFDQRADSAEQCIELISPGNRPTVKSAKVYILYGDLSDDEISEIKKHVINPVESRLASMDVPKTLKIEYSIPTEVETLKGFIDLDETSIHDFVKKYGLAMDSDDLLFCQDYFKQEKRDPTITEIRMIDTYWSDHCRHTTFLTTIDSVSFEDELLQNAWEDYISTRQYLGRTKPINLMDIGTIAAKYLKSLGKLDKLDESEEINACTVKIEIEVDGVKEPWLLLFKNETHNHPTEIEPFGGAATCIGGAIRDPLSGRSYVYAAMRVTGAADPLTPVKNTIPGKLPQRKIVTTAAAGYSSYGNQIGLATGIVDELYHPGYAAKRMEIGAVIAATPQENVRRERPQNNDKVILIGGRTGRDGCGGATGSSKSHTITSLETCGAEVQKGNAPEERKLQRLFRNKEACLLIKRCNDFGAGGVSVAIGELADGLEIDLNAVVKKYDGLDGTELAISESQERMAVVVAPEDVDRFLKLADSENLEATVVAEVKDEPRLKMKWNGKYIVDISREFLNSNGAQKHIDIIVPKMNTFKKEIGDSFSVAYTDLAQDLNVCSKRGLSERFDSTIGANTVLMPFGGINQTTPIQAMVHKIPVEKGHTNDCSVMSWGYNPFITQNSPYHGAYLAVVESCAKLVATGAKFEDVYLSFQEYFLRPNKDSIRWGQPLAALLGAFEAQRDLGVAAIGGKDSMSGTFEQLDVPPTLVSFAVTTDKCENIISNDFKSAGHKVIHLTPVYNQNELPDPSSLLLLFKTVNELIVSKLVYSAYTPTYGGIAEAVMKMCFGNSLGFEFSNAVSLDEIFGYSYGSFLLEVDESVNLGKVIGYIKQDPVISYKNETVNLLDLNELYENKLEPVYKCNIATAGNEYELPTFKTTNRTSPAIKHTKPKFLIPVFPGTNCEYDTAKKIYDAGGEAEIFVINNLTADGIQRSIENFSKILSDSQVIFIPGGFSAGDEPDGSGKFITAFFRNKQISDGVADLLDNRDGLMCGICNGFQALIKLGLVPYGKIIDTDENCPTLTFNSIGRHQSKLVRTKIISNKSPWLSAMNPGQVITVPISHGEGRFLASNELIKSLNENGQIATQYVNNELKPTDEIQFNPNNSSFAIEGITSPDGRVFGKMGHSERTGSYLYKNVPGLYDIHLFDSAVAYYK